MNQYFFKRFPHTILQRLFQKKSSKMFEQFRDELLRKNAGGIFETVPAISPEGISKGILVESFGRIFEEKTWKKF